MNGYIVLRLVGGAWEGSWLAVTDISQVPDWLSPTDDGMARVPMVSTGTVEWHHDRPAEVFVPEDMLPVWRAEHETLWP